jgi:hypothetical protein
MPRLGCLSAVGLGGVFSGGTVFLLTEEHLKELGFSLVGDRLYFIEVLTQLYDDIVNWSAALGIQLATHPVPPLRKLGLSLQPTSWTVKDVCKVLKAVNLGEYIELFVEHRVQGDVSMHTPPGHVPCRSPAPRSSLLAPRHSAAAPTTARVLTGGRARGPMFAGDLLPHRGEPEGDGRGQGGRPAADHRHHADALRADHWLAAAGGEAAQLAAARPVGVAHRNARRAVAVRRGRRHMARHSCCKPVVCVRAALQGGRLTLEPVPAPLDHPCERMHRRWPRAGRSRLKARSRLQCMGRWIWYCVAW